MKRSIITIDEEKCTGCGECLPGCPEGALQIIDGKARLVSDLFCDGLGACINACPEGAMTVEEREAEPYDEKRVMGNIIRQGPNTIRAHLKHLDDHNEKEYLSIALEVLKQKGIEIPKFRESPVLSSPSCGGGCPGSEPVTLGPAKGHPEVEKSGFQGGGSELRQWPVQLKLLNPGASFFDGADILIAADCVPAACGNFHQKFLKGRVMIMFCPKLDPFIEEYVDKLAAILIRHEVRSITVVRMEVPCCGGVNTILQRAIEKAGKTFFVKDYVLSMTGEPV